MTIRVKNENKNGYGGNKSKSRSSKSREVSKILHASISMKDVNDSISEAVQRGRLRGGGETSDIHRNSIFQQGEGQKLEPHAFSDGKNTIQSTHSKIQNTSKSDDSQLVKISFEEPMKVSDTAEITGNGQKKSKEKGSQKSKENIDSIKKNSKKSCDDSATMTTNTSVRSNVLRVIAKKKENVVSGVKHRMKRAYTLIKEGDESKKEHVDHYKERTDAGGELIHNLIHDDETLYINVIIRNSVKIVENELKKMAVAKWGIESVGKSKPSQLVRILTQTQMIRFAGIALEANLTPKIIARQLSNDLYRYAVLLYFFIFGSKIDYFMKHIDYCFILYCIMYRILSPGLAKQGVEVETDIEYRARSFFVLGVNILSIDWVKLMAYSNAESRYREENWMKKRESKSRPKNSIKFFSLTWNEVVSKFLAWLHFLPWMISVPFWKFLYYLFLKRTIHLYILKSITDDIYEYVEKKGMEMDLVIKEASEEARFMLEALRELRNSEKILNKKKREATDGKVVTPELRGALLGPMIKADAGPARNTDNFIIPENLDNVTFEMELPVGFRRLRWAFLHSSSKFLLQALNEDVLKYTDMEVINWDKYVDEIGLPTTPNDVNEEDFIGATKKLQYLVPKSAFVSATTCYETVTLLSHNDYCFATKSECRCPGVPYGKTFISWNQTVVSNIGENTCKIVCSVEAEFPNGPPLVARQIRSGMRTVSAETCMKLGELICQYADEVP